MMSASKIRDIQPWLDALFRYSLDGVALFDEEGKMLLCNNAFERITGMDAATLHNRYFYDIAFELMPHQKKSHELYEMLKHSVAVLANTEKVDFIHMGDFQIMRSDGSTIDVRQMPIPVCLDKGDGFLLIIRDVSEEKKIDREIRTSRDFLQTAIESSLDGIMIVDNTGTIRSVNSAVERFFGYSRQELVGKHTSELVVNDPKVRRNVRKAMEELFEKGFATYETQHRAKDGHIVEIESTATMLKDEQGNLMGGIAILRDVSVRKRAEQHLRQVQKMEALGTLAGGIAHDFNNILAAIIGYTELSLQRVEPESTVAKNLEKILASALRARDLVRHILTFSRAQESERRPVVIAHAINDVVKLLQATLPKTIEIRQALLDKDAAVFADPVHIEQILMNLCVNAGQAMHQSGGVLEIGLTREVIDQNEKPDLAPGNYIAITVKDTGPGIEKSIQHRIFDPFFTTKEIGKGTGMGLAVVMGIVKGLKGTISVESEPGKGALFRVLLPAINGPATEIAVDAAPLPGGKERILFVDDEQDIIDSIGKALGSLGYQVTACTSALEALDIFSQNPHAFDIIVTDQTMPKMTGFEFAKIALASRPDIPVVLCTGFSETVSEDDARTIGIRKFIMKPLNQQELAITLRQVLENNTIRS
ncbi:MAG: PAS domain S-box protein [Desulfobacterota bacterium]|nr:PAS domain S-box protein [Thermodesulfobacteriota bacterium]